MNIYSKVLFLAIALGALWSCGGSEEQPKDTAQESKQTISGNIKNAQGKMIIAQVYNADRWTQLGNASIDDQGNFSIKLPKEPFLVQLIVDNRAIPMVLGGNDSVFVSCEFPNMMESFHVKNMEHASELNKMASYIANFNKNFSDKLALLNELQIGEEADKLRAEITAGKKKADQYAIEFIQKNPNAPLSQLMALQLFPDMGLEHWNLSYADHLKTVLDAYRETFPEARFTRGLESSLSLWTDSYEQTLNAQKRKAFYGNLDRNVEIGSPAPDIWMDKADGGEMKLSDLKGNYVLVDFWASWCGPCRRENPNVVRLYKKYKDKGFTVFSVSLDDNAANWKAAIESDELIWPNHVSDLMKWNSVVVQLYKFDGIPHTVLLDKKGTIIGKNLRGQELENKLKEIFGS